MPQPLRMHQVKRIIEFHPQGRSIRQIGRLFGISRNTIQEYLRRIALNERSLAELLLLDDESLLTIVQTDPIENNRSRRTADDRYGSIESRLEYYKTELGRRGVTRQVLWQGIPQ